MIDYKRDRRERSDGIGFFTYWDKKSLHGCIYCGKLAETREHIPSKVFLNKPYPDNLFTIPACSKCNGSYSTDEEYTACYIETVKATCYDAPLIERIERIYTKKPALKALIHSQISSINGEIKLSYDSARIIRILYKLAICLAGFEFDYLYTSDTYNVWFDFASNLSPNTSEEFLKPQYGSVLPEISSRFSTDYCAFISSDNGEIITVLYDWIIIQEKQFKYQILIEESGVSVKMVISNYLFSKVDLY